MGCVFPRIARSEVIRWGRNLDKIAGGAGLGLDIVQDITQLYRDCLKIETSSLNGVYVVLELPAAE